MKIDRTRSYSDKGQIEIITREIRKDRLWVMLMLIILIIALAACNRPQRASSGAVGGASVTGTPTPPGDAGGAILNLDRKREYHDPNGTDTQREVGAIPLKFSKASEENYLLVEGTGKIEWTEKAEFPVCYFTAKADVAVTVRGLFSLADCKFHLTIDTKYSPPVTSNQSPDCTAPIYFSETEFSSQIELDPSTGHSKDSITNGWWEISNVKLSDLKSDVVNNCFVPEVIERSTTTP